MASPRSCSRSPHLGATSFIPRTPSDQNSVHPKADREDMSAIDTFSHSDDRGNTTPETPHESHRPARPLAHTLRRIGKLAIAVLVVWFAVLVSPLTAPQLQL